MHLTACGILVPQPGTEPVPLAFLTTGPPGKSQKTKWLIPTSTAPN